VGKKVYAIDTKPGIQRDGTLTSAGSYVAGEWVRFQRNLPRKIGGFREITNQMQGYSRGIYVNSEDGYNSIYNGYNNGIERIVVDNAGIGAGITEYDMNGGPVLTTGTLVGGSAYTNATYTAVALTGGSGSGAKATIVVSGGAVTSVTITTAGNGYIVGDTLSAATASIGGTGSGFSCKVATVGSSFTSSDLNLWQFDGFFDATGSGDNLLLAHPGLNLEQIDNTNSTAVLAGDINGSIMYPLKDTSGTSPTGATISVSGGVVALHPYVFVYGDNGLIQNCSAGNVFDWNSPDTNEVNVSSQKIVKGLPVRGGSNAPAGLFWALDSLIRVSYAPTTISTGTGTAQLFWRYDIIGSSSILSSQSVIEYDGVYYWCGVDRFLLYNGTIKEIPNTFNQNWFYDNLNYAQRQKVWATKVTRFGEIWWFYPRGDATECNDVIIYNVRENIWYDIGSAAGAKRTAGYYSQVFHYPVMAGEDLSEAENILTQNILTTNAKAVIVTASSSLIQTGLVVSATGVTANSTITAVAPCAAVFSATIATTTMTVSAVTSGFISVGQTISGTGVTAATTIIALGSGTGGVGTYTVSTSQTVSSTVTVTALRTGFYNVTLSANCSATATVSADFYTVANQISLWQHEIGTDEVKGESLSAIYSSFETSDLGLVTGGPAAPSPVGENFWLHLARVEPDFVQSGEMEMYIIGRPFAQSTDVTTGPYLFDADTGKIDLREQRRELRLKFVSNVQGGNYQLGYLLLTADIGDVRPY
jgi:hypothetical protein